jgi:hypothetical protein
MSKAKGLEFDRSQPAFLRRLRGEISGQTDDPDRHVDAAARPKRPKRLDADEDDGPTYVMEDTNATLTKDEYEALVKGGEANDANSASNVHAGTTQTGADGKGKAAQKLGSIGVVKKRKAARVLGGEDEENDEDSQKTVTSKAAESAGATSKGVEKKAPKKKKAKVKIDFGDDVET